MTRAMRDSGVGWLGDIPTDWNVVPSRALFGERKTRSSASDIHLTPSQKYGVLPQSQYMEITGNKVVLNLSGSDNMRHVEPGDYISHLRSFQGGLEHATLSGKVSAAYTVLKPKTPVDARYFKYLFKSALYVQALQTTTDQLRDGQSIRFGEFSLIPLPHPPIAEQRAIADFLDRETAQIDAFITKNEELITLLTERRAAVIMHTTRSLVGDALGEKLGYTCQLGNGSTPRREDARYWDGGDFPWLNSSVVNLDRVDEAEEFVTAIARSECHLPRLHPGAIVVGLTGEGRTRGMATMVHIEATINQHLAYIQPNERVWHPDYLLWLMHSLYRELRDLSDANGSTKGGLTVSQLRGLRVIRPPLGEQLRISAALDKETARIAQAVNTARRGIELARERRAALISAAVTGKIDVGVSA